MISRIKGKITEKKQGVLIVDIGSICYEVLMPIAVMKSFENNGENSEAIELVIYHYYQMEQSRAMPVLIGFQNVVEKEFFEKFISVSGVGPKAACKALAEPFSKIAGAIDAGDFSFLQSLPGIGNQKAKLIVAKLQGKVGKYGLIRDHEPDAAGVISEDIKNDALEVLIQLQYKKVEAEGMIEKALSRNPELKTSEELLNEVYRERSEI